MVPAALAYRVGLTAATTRPCTDTSRTRSPRLTVASRTRSSGTVSVAFAQRPTAGAASQPAMTTPAATKARTRLRLSLLGGASLTSCDEVSAILFSTGSCGYSGRNQCLDAPASHFVCLRRDPGVSGADRRPGLDLVPDQ